MGILVSCGVCVSVCVPSTLQRKTNHKEELFYDKELFMKVNWLVFALVACPPLFVNTNTTFLSSFQISC